MHNVLKNFRSLSPESADRLMETLKIDIPELLFRFQGMGDLSVRAVPVVRSRVGPGFNPLLTNFAGFFPLPATLVDPLTEPVMIQLAADMVLPSPLRRNDLILLDQDPASRRQPGGNSCWLVAENWGIRVRYVRMGGTQVYIADESTVRDPARWIPVSLKRRDILEVIKARVVWFSRAIGAKGSAWDREAEPLEEGPPFF